MTRVLRLALACAALLAFFAPAAAEARSCSERDPSITRLAAKGVSCSVAKRVASTHARRDCGAKCRFRASRRSWSCRKKGSTVRCSARGRRSVSWGVVGQEPTPAPPTSPTPPPGGTTPPPAPQQDAITRFREVLRFSRFDRVSVNSTTGHQLTERFDFCDGTFSYYSESIGTVSSTTSAQGTWEVTEAAFNEQGTAAQGRVRYTSNNPDFPGGEVIITLVGQNQAYIGETEYQRTPGGAAC